MGEIVEFMGVKVEIDPPPDPVYVEWLEAVKRGDVAIVADRLRRGMDVNAGGDGSNVTALMWAVRLGHTEIVRLLLEHGADLNPDDGCGRTAMTYAVISSRTWEDYWHVPRPDPGPLQLLLAAGGQYRLYEAVLLNDVELARARLDEGADVNTGEGEYDGPMLKIAAELGYLDMVDLLLDRGANIESMDDLGQRPLLSAARYGRTEVVRRLLDRGADINADDWSGQTALSNAAIEDHHDTYDLLLSRGARRGVVDALARNDIELLIEKLGDESDVDWLTDGRKRLAMLAAGRGNVAAVGLLLDRGAVHLKKGFIGEDHSLLAEAARRGHVEVAQLLIDRGADLNAVGRDELTPLAWAIQEGRDDVAALLRHAGAT